LLYVAGGAFAVGTNIMMLVKTLKGGWMRIGGYMAHVGFAVLLLGIVGSSAYATPDARLSLSPGESTKIYGYEFIFNGYKLDDQQRGVLDFTVSNGSTTFSAKPYLYENPRMGATMTTPSIHSVGWQDLYISPAGYDPERDAKRPVLGQDESTAIGPYTVTFNGFNLDREAMLSGSGQMKVGAKLTVAYEGKAQEYEPYVEVVNNTTTGKQELKYIGVDLPGGAKLTVVSLDPNSRRVMLEGTGNGLDSLPVVPAKGIIAVSTKPLVLLVWIGMSITVIGGLIALMRRYLEGGAALVGARVRLPKGLPAISPRFGSRGTGR
jgi:cytochrome c-type biogenesis protein CcmF